MASQPKRGQNVDNVVDLANVRHQDKRRKKPEPRLRGAIIERINKCLERANRPNTAEQEAKAALFLSSRLMTRYNYWTAFRGHDDGNAGFFDNVHNLSPWLGDAFKPRCVSDFYVRRVEDSSPQFPGFVRHHDVALRGKYVLYYTILSSLPVNKCCTKYIRSGSSQLTKAVNPTPNVAACTADYPGQKGADTRYEYHCIR